VDDIQRWDAVDTMYEVSTGEWVTYADHVAAVAAAEQRVLDEERTKEKWFCSEEDKQALIAHGVQAARDAVAALPAYYAIEECQGNPLEKGDPEDPDPWKQGHLIERDDALAAIDGVTPNA